MDRQIGEPFVYSEARTEAGRVRKGLDRIEQWIPNLRGAGPQALELLSLFDQVNEGLAGLVEAGVDMRAESIRFEGVQRRLYRSRKLFLAEAGAALEEKRTAERPDPTAVKAGQMRWWWFLDEVTGYEGQQRLRRVLIGGLAAVLVLGSAWVIYERFLAPPREVRMSYRHVNNGAILAKTGDLEAALAEFEAAAELTPDNPDPWLWQGVAHVEMGEMEEAEAAFERARSLFASELDFMIERSKCYARMGDLDRAGADAEQAILENPDSGWGYYQRGEIYFQGGDYGAAVVYYQIAAELARESGDVTLEAAALEQRAAVIQRAGPMLLTPSPQEGGDDEP